MCNKFLNGTFKKKVVILAIYEEQKWDDRGESAKEIFSFSFAF